MAHRWTRIAAALFIPSGPADEGTAPAQARCDLGQHAWLNPEDSIRSARSGYRLAYCRFCTACYPVERQPAASPAVRFKRVGVPLSG